MRKRNKPHTKESMLAESRQSGACLLWPSLKSNGYGYLSYKGKSTYAHRVSYILHYGQDIPVGLEVDHTCNNRACINPTHLELVSHPENMGRAKNRRDTCRAGHLFDDINTRLFVVKRKQGGTRIQRYCLKCRAEHQAAHRKRKKTIK